MYTNGMSQKPSQSGIALVLVLVFASVFGVSVAGLMGFTLTQSRLGITKAISEEAFNIAEAGLEYYHWFLSHYPTDVQDGTGAPGPYVHTYASPETGAVGEYSLDITGNFSCGVLQSVDVRSTGVSDADTRFARTVYGRHARPSVAEYAYIIDEDVWVGPDSEITGPEHSNGGIRMDGTNNSLVTSAVATWTCDSSFGCSPTQTVNGVFGSGPHSSLWQYPVQEIDFNLIGSNFASLKTYAQTEGVYLPPYGTRTQNVAGYQVATNGYHLIFNSDGTVDIYRVTQTSGWWGWLTGIGWRPDMHIITNEVFLERRSIPATCALIFVEDKTWVEGVVSGKVAVVVAEPGHSYNPDVILRDDITYATDGSVDGITIIAEGGIFIPPQSPDDLELNGIFVAQGDRFGRAYYSNDMKSQLTLRGTVVSTRRVGTQWTCSGTPCSGYLNRDNSYDRLQTTNPPPFTPVATTTARYIMWREE